MSTIPSVSAFSNIASIVINIPVRPAYISLLERENERKDRGEKGIDHGVMRILHYLDNTSNAQP
jgi:hypothetical protein